MCVPFRFGSAALVLACCLTRGPEAWAHEGPHDAAPEIVKRWQFTPEYMLTGAAATPDRPRMPHPRGDHPLAELETPPVLLRGLAPTQRLRSLLESAQIPRDAFTVELWLCHHVNTPVDAIVATKGTRAGDTVPWIFGFGNWKTYFAVTRNDGSTVELASELKPYGGFKERWVHQVLSFDGHELRLYVNGQLQAMAPLKSEDIAWPVRDEWEMAAYLANEPEMQFANLMEEVTLYQGAVSAAHVEARFQELCDRVHDGRLFADLFHFTAGPYLNYCDQTSIRLCWETDRRTTAEVRWGPTADLAHGATLDTPKRKHDFRIDGLEPNTPYFYEIRCTEAVDSNAREVDKNVSSSSDTTHATDTSTISSGMLTFKTAVRSDEPFRFAVLGDTESRPHINDRLAKQIWGERPNFVINLGDLTDAGREPHRYEWTHEYFLGITQLASRVPMFAVPGNGESDLVWYSHYHNYPGSENFYQFRFGNAAFFMLDSNRREEEFAPGGKQYRWLDEQLAACDATWKFVCHHHATYTGEEDDYGDSWQGPSQFGDQAVRRMVPLYEKHHVDMVMFGHLHLYERSLPIRKGRVDVEMGTIHLLAGGGGGNLEDFAPTPAFFSAQVHRGHHYVTIAIQGDRLELRMHDLEGDLRDLLVVEKSATPAQLRVTRQDPAESAPQ